jgi:hypothetical protein
MQFASRRAAAAILAVAALGGNVGADDAAATKSARSALAPLDPLDPSAVPPDSVGMMCLRTAPLAARPELQPAVRFLRRDFVAEIDHAEAERFVELRSFLFDRLPSGATARSAYCLRFDTPDQAQSLAALIDMFGRRALKRRHAAHEGNTVWTALDAEAFAAARKPSAGPTAWSALLRDERAPFVLAADLQRIFAVEPLPTTSPVPQVAELLSALKSVRLGIARGDVQGDQVVIELRVVCADADGATRLKAAVQSLAAFGCTSLKGVPPTALRQVPGVDAAMVLTAARDALGAAEARAEGTQATLALRAPAAVVGMAVRLFDRAEDSPPHKERPQPAPPADKGSPARKAP